MGTIIRPDPTPVLPTLNGFSVKKKPVYASIPQTMVSGWENRILLQAFPLWEFELTYEVLRSETQNISLYAQNSPHIELEQLMWVFLACGGQYGRFYYNDPTDYNRAGQAIGVGDGTTTDFRIVRTWGYGDLAGIEPVGAMNTEQFPVVYLSGVAVGNLDWNLSADLQTIEFVTAPADTVVITADFSFYYRCRFLVDLIEMEQFVTNKWLLQSLRFQTVKDCDLTTPNPYILTEAAF